jgi:hypothetical protein
MSDQPRAGGGGSHASGRQRGGGRGAAPEDVRALDAHRKALKGRRKPGVVALDQRQRRGVVPEHVPPAGIVGAPGFDKGLQLSRDHVRLPGLVQQRWDTGMLLLLRTLFFWTWRPACISMLVLTARVDGGSILLARRECCCPPDQEQHAAGCSGYQYLTKTGSPHGSGGRLVLAGWVLQWPSCHCAASACIDIALRAAPSSMATPARSPRWPSAQAARASRRRGQRTTQYTLTLCPGGLFLFQCVEISALLTQIDQPDTMQGLYRVMT